MKYEQVWDAVDKLASINGLSPSGLAKKAGLDATTFNKSKRIRPDGKKRWPSLDSINKLLETCNVTFEQLYSLGGNDEYVSLNNTIPYIAFSNLLNFDAFEKNQLNTSNWDKVRFPDSADNVYAIDLNSEAFLPLYRSGTMLVVSKNSEIRRNDRIVILLRSGSILIHEFIHRTAKTLEVKNPNSNEQTESINIADIRLINRIIWASQ